MTRAKPPLIFACNEREVRLFVHMRYALKLILPNEQSDEEPSYAFDTRTHKLEKVTGQRNDDSDVDISSWESTASWTHVKSFNLLPRLLDTLAPISKPCPSRWLLSSSCEN